MNSNLKKISISSIEDVYKIRLLRNTFDEIIIHSKYLKYSGCLKYCLKYALFAAKISGIIKVFDEPTKTYGFSRRTIDCWQVLYQCAQTFYDDCNELLIDKKKSKFVYKKIKDSYENEGLSFGIVFSGNDEEIESLSYSVESCINQTKKENLEILICGPSNFDLNKLPKLIKKETKYIKYDQKINSSRFLVNEKKRFIFENSKFNIVAINHCRISYPQNFYEKIYNYPIEFCTPRVVAIQRNKEFNYLGLSFLGSYDVTKTDSSFSFQGEIIDRDYLYYMKNKYPFIGGGLFVLNKNIISSSIFDSKIAWGEAEDIDLSMKVYTNGFLIDFFHDIKCTSNTRKYTFNNSIQRRILRKIGKFLIKNQYI